MLLIACEWHYFYLWQAEQGLLMKMFMAYIDALSSMRLDCFCENLEQYVWGMMELQKNFPILCSVCAYIQSKLI